MKRLIAVTECEHTHLRNLEFCHHCGKRFVDWRVWKYGVLWFWNDTSEQYP